MKVVSLTDFLKADMKGKLIVNVMLPPFSSNNKLKTYKVNETITPSDTFKYVRVLKIRIIMIIYFR